MAARFTKFPIDEFPLHAGARRFCDGKHVHSFQQIAFAMTVSTPEYRETGVKLQDGLRVVAKPVQGESSDMDLSCSLFRRLIEVSTLR